MAKYVANGMYKGGHMHVELDTGEKPDIGAFRKLMEECKATFGGGYVGDDVAVTGAQQPPLSTKPIQDDPPTKEPALETVEDDDDDLSLEDEEPEELPFSRKDVTAAAQGAITDSDDDTKGARKKVAAIFKKLGGSTKLADIEDSKYGKIIRALKAGI